MVHYLSALYIDDSFVVRDGLRSILAANGEVDVVGEAVDGLTGVAMADELLPDVVLMDAQMPRMDGVEATRLIKKRLPGIKVLFLTVHAEHVAAALQAQADGYLLKDCGRQTLVQAVRELGRRNTLPRG